MNCPIEIDVADSREPIMPTTVRHLRDASRLARLIALVQIIAEHNTPKFTQALLDHFYEAKRRALADVRGAGLTPATES